MNKVMDVFRCVLLTIATLVSLSNSCYGKTNNRKDHELRGPVSAVVVKNIEFSIKFGEVVPTGKSNDTLYYFLKNGNVYAEVYTPNKYKRFEYDGHNNLTEEMCVNVGEGKECEIGDSIYLLNDTTNHKLNQYVYDSEDRLKEIKCFTKWNDYLKQYHRIVYTYTSKGKTITYYKEEGIEKEESYFGNMHVKKEYPLKEGIADIIETETLDENRNPIKVEIKMGKSFALVNVFITYNEYGNQIKIVKNGTVQNQQRKSTETIQYVYDKQGNWIKKMHYEDGKLKEWIEREISYAVSDSDYSKNMEEIKRMEVGSQAKRKRVLTEENAQFPGGDYACFNWLSEHIHMPAEAMENGIQGRVIVNFIIECDGSISCVRIVRGVSEALDKEALRVVKSMPKWKPAMQDGQPVRSEFTLPIMFRLN